MLCKLLGLIGGSAAYLRKGCRKTVFSGIRFILSMCSIRLRRSVASEERYRGTTYFPCATFLSVPCSSSPLNGGAPVRIVKRRTPRDQMSAVWSYAWPLTISGEM